MGDDLNDYNGFKGHDIIISLKPRWFDGKCKWFKPILRHYMILQGKKKTLYYTDYYGD